MPTHCAKFIKKQQLLILAIQERIYSSNPHRDFYRNTNKTSELMEISSNISELDNVMSMVSNTRQIARELNEALVRINSGTYGVCEISKEIIPEERLEAIPWARYTVDVQNKLEKTNCKNNNNSRISTINQLFSDVVQEESDEPEIESKKD